MRKIKTDFRPRLASIIIFPERPGNYFSRVSAPLLPQLPPSFFFASLILLPPLEISPLSFFFPFFFFEFIFSSSSPSGAPAASNN